MIFATGALTLVILADRAAFWSLLFFGKIRVSSPAQPKAKPAADAAAEPIATIRRTGT